MSVIRKDNHERRRIAAIGTWDGVHIGHAFLLDFVRSQGAERGLTPSAVTFCNHPLSIIAPDKAPVMLSSVDERVHNLEVSGVDDVILLEFDDALRSMTAREFISMLKHRYDVDAVVMGFNHRFGSDRIDSFDEYRAIGGDENVEIICAPEYRSAGRPVSSSAIRRLLADGCVEDAADALGRRYELSGTVVHGMQLGRKLGFPTANVLPDDSHKAVPGCGVYACYVVTGTGKCYKAVVNVGRRPTVCTENKISVEAYILDFAGNLYGSRITLRFVAKLRDECKFPSLEMLKTQIEHDAAVARIVLDDLSFHGREEMP